MRLRLLLHKLLEPILKPRLVVVRIQLTRGFLELIELTLVYASSSHATCPFLTSRTSTFCT